MLCNFPQQHVIIALDQQKRVRNAAPTYPPLVFCFVAAGSIIICQELAMFFNPQPMRATDKSSTKGDQQF